MSYVGLGAGEPPTYASTVVGLVNSISGDPTIRNELSPGALAALDITSQALINVAKGGNLTDQLAGLALQTATEILKSLAKSVGLETLVSAGSSIPFLGAIIGVVGAIAGGPKAHGVSLTPDEQTKYCSTSVQQGGWFRAPRLPGTAPNGDLLPCDLLVFDNGYNAKGEPWFEPTDLSEVIRLLTETTGSQGGAGDAKSHLGTYGLSAARRAVYSQLRRAIQATRKRFGTDGGATLWIIYVDMLRADFDAGRLTGPLMQYLHVLDGGAMSGLFSYGDAPHSVAYNDSAQQAQDKRDVAAILLGPVPWRCCDSGISAARAYDAELLKMGRGSMMCGLWTNAARQQLLDILQVWRQTLKPYYVQFQSLASKAKAATDAYFKKSPSGGQQPPPVTQQTTAANVAAIQKAYSYTAASLKQQQTAKAKMSPVVAVLLGVAVMGAGVGGLAYWKGRKSSSRHA